MVNSSSWECNSIYLDFSYHNIPYYTTPVISCYIYGIFPASYGLTDLAGPVSPLSMSSSTVVAPFAGALPGASVFSERTRTLRGRSWWFLTSRPRVFVGRIEGWVQDGAPKIAFSCLKKAAEFYVFGRYNYS